MNYIWLLCLFRIEAKWHKYLKGLGMVRESLTAIARKRQRFESTTSETCTKLLHMITRGRISVTGAVDLANCMLEDGMVNRAVDSFASLGSNNKFPSNGERDFHRWLRDLFGFRLQTYTVWMDLQDAQLYISYQWWFTPNGLEGYFDPVSTFLTPNGL